MARLSRVEIDDAGLPPPTPDIEQDRRVALFDLMEENRFGLPDRPGGGPWALRLGLRGASLHFAVDDAAGRRAAEFQVSLGPLRQVIKDYLAICASYQDAVRRLPPSRIEAIDAGRRSIHDEASRLLLERLSGRVDTDLATARRLFTLICALRHEG